MRTCPGPVDATRTARPCDPCRARRERSPKCLPPFGIRTCSRRCAKRNCPGGKESPSGGATVEFITPFPSPEDWRDQWIYFLLMDRFNNPRTPPANLPWDGEVGVFQGGTYNGVRAQLDYLQDLGAGALWLSPVSKNCQYNPYSYHGYGIMDFLQIDPRFASDPQAAASDPGIAEEELRGLIDEAHARGIYVIFDIVLNHCGDIFAYAFEDGSQSSEANWRDGGYTVYWRDETGHGRPDWTAPPASPHTNAAVWPTDLRRNEMFRRKGMGGEAAGDFASLKEMVTDLTAMDAANGFHYPVRNILIRAYQALIAKFDVDGFRIDTLKYIEPEFAQSFGNAMREFALSIGKKNFFTFGEVYDNEDKINRFIGRHANDPGDLVGVDAALDFPLFYKLPTMAKGQCAPSEVVGMYQYRKQAEQGLLSSHGEAGNYFVTFLDNHDQYQRFFYRDPNDPARFEDQLTLGVACLFSLQGVPCLYYGTEQGLHGSGGSLEAVREALWGKVPVAFDPAHPFYKAIRELSAVRSGQPALRYGRQYFRPVSGDGVRFGVSPFPGGILAFSRILNDREVVVVANTNTTAPWSGEVLVDLALHAAGSTFDLLYSNKKAASGSASPVTAPGPAADKPAGSVEIHEVTGAVTNGPARSIRVTLLPMEVQVLGKGGTN